MNFQAATHIHSDFGKKMTYLLQNGIAFPKQLSLVSSLAAHTRDWVAGHVNTVKVQLSSMIVGEKEVKIKTVIYLCVYSGGQNCYNC